MKLITETELATEILRLDGDAGAAVKKAAKLRCEKKWPHAKFGRFDVRYTEAQVEQIIAMHAITASPAATPRPAIPGQTKRSAARKRS